MQETETAGDPKITIWQIAILLLSIYVLSAICASIFFPLPAETIRLLGHIDNLICFIFLGDFIYNLVTAKKKLAYLKWGWISLLASIPHFQFLRWGRLPQLIRLLWLLSKLHSVKSLVKSLFRDRARSTLTSVALLAILLIIACSIAILNLEQAPDSNIETAADALWWSFVTVTTVGYGDTYPTTLPGRLVASLLMATGIGLFSTLTAFVSSHFLMRAGRKEMRRDKEILAELKTIRKKLAKLENKLAEDHSAMPEEDRS